ncbi:MAG: LysR family transcriptional regulator, partial [Pseudomonadota bacterium]
MNWDDLKIVLAIHRSKSMSQAARMLEIDPSTATRRLAAIESDLGAILFSRSKSGLAATDAGQIAIEHALE